MTARLPQGEATIARMCMLAGVSRAGYYRHWAASAPRQEETGVRDAIQRLALAHPHYGYRRIAAQLRREGLAVNHKRVLRLMREDNLLCLRKRAFVPATTDSRHGWRVVANLARGMVPTGVDQLWVADITYIRLQEEFAFLAIVLDAFSRRVTVAAPVHLLLLERFHEALRLGIVIRIADPAHARLDVVGGEQRRVRVAGVLHAAIGMMDQAAGRGPAGRNRQARLQMCVQRPTDYASAEGVEHDGKESKLLLQADIGDVRHP